MVGAPHRGTKWKQRPWYIHCSRKCKHSLSQFFKWHILFNTNLLSGTSIPISASISLFLQTCLSSLGSSLAFFSQVSSLFKNSHVPSSSGRCSHSYGGGGVRPSGRPGSPWWAPLLPDHRWPGQHIYGLFTLHTRRSASPPFMFYGCFQRQCPDEVQDIPMIVRWSYW